MREADGLATRVAQSGGAAAAAASALSGLPSVARAFESRMRAMLE
jgi:hypothetical protein